MDEWPIFLLRAAAQRRLDDAVRRAHDRGQFGPRVDVQLLIDIHKMRGYRSFADAEPFCDLPVGKTVDNVTDNLALPMTEFLIEDGSHLSLRNKVRNAGPVRLILAPHESAEFAGLILLEQIQIVKLPRVLHSHRHERIFVISRKDFPAGRTGESQHGFPNLLRHAGAALSRSISKRAPRSRSTGC